MIIEQRSKGIANTGFSASSLRVVQSRTTASGRFISNFELVGIGYWNFLFSKKGRKPGKFAPVNKIMQWVRQRRIQFRNLDTGKFLTTKQTAFLINKGIRDQGTRIFQTPSKGVNIERIIDRHLSNAGDELAKEIVQDYEERLNKIIIG
jgi:hypothetical protein